MPLHSLIISDSHIPLPTLVVAFALGMQFVPGMRLGIVTPGELIEQPQSPPAEKRQSSIAMRPADWPAPKHISGWPPLFTQDSARARSSWQAQSAAHCANCAWQPRDTQVQQGLNAASGGSVGKTPGVQPASSESAVPGGAEPVDGPELGGTALPEFEPTDPDGIPAELEAPTGAIASSVEPPSTPRPPPCPPQADASANTPAFHGELRTGVRAIGSPPQQWPHSPMSIKKMLDKCLLELNAARELDPAGEQDPRVREYRERAEHAVQKR